MFWVIKKSWPVADFLYGIPFLSLLFYYVSVFTQFSSVCPQSKNPKTKQTSFSSIAANEDRRLRFAAVVSYLHQEANPTPSWSPLTPTKIHHKTKPKPSSSPRKSQTHAVLISIDAKEDPRLGFTVVVSHLHRQHSKIEPEIELLTPPTHHSKMQVRTSLSPCFSTAFLCKDWIFPSSLRCVHLFVFFVFGFSSVFFLTNRENPFFQFFVCCWENSWFTIQIYASKCRRVSSKSVAVVNLFWFWTQSISIFLNTLFGCRESVGILNKKKKKI